MKVLVTGATGFLGRCVVESLLRHGCHDLRLVARSSNPALVERMAKLAPTASIEWCLGDLLEPDFSQTATRGVDVVYHLAASLSGNAAEVILNTAVGTDNLFAALQRNGVRRVVLVSSFSVYNPGTLRWNTRLTESAPLETHPEWRDPYTYGKLKQEALLHKYKLPHAIVRPGVIYGEGGSVLSARIGLRVGPVFLHLGGRSWLPLTYVENCAEAVVLAGLTAGVDGEVFNIVDDELLRAHQFRRRYNREVSRLKSVTIPYPLLLLLAWAMLKYHRLSHGQLPAALTPYKVRAMWKRCRFDNTKAKRLLGWQPSIGLAEALQRTFAYHHQRSR